MSKTLTDLVDPFDLDVSKFGYKLNNIYGFQINKGKLQEIIDRSESDIIHLGFNSRSADLVLRELSPDKLRLALRLADKMFKAKDSSIMGIIQLNETYRDVERVRQKLNDERWMDKD